MGAERSFLQLLPACAKEEMKKRPREDPSGKGFVSRFHSGLVHKAVSIKAEMKEPGARAAAEIKRNNFEKLAGWDVRKGGPAIKPEKSKTRQGHYFLEYDVTFSWCV